MEARSPRSNFRNFRNEREKGRQVFGRSNSLHCTICNRSSHSTKDCWFKGKPKCDKCHRFGHLSKDCRSCNVQQANQMNFQKQNEETHTTFFAYQSTMHQKNKRWLLDSGCSNHMSPEKEIFCNIDSSINTPVKLGNGQLVESKGMGSISIQTEHGTSQIQNVLLVPSLHENLLSLGQLLENGYKLEFDKNMCNIYDKKDKKKVMTTIEMKNRIFSLNIKYAPALHATTSNEPVSSLWHKRLGHVNFQSLKVLYNQRMVHGLPYIEEDKRWFVKGVHLENNIDNHFQKESHGEQALNWS